ncbi:MULTISPECIES: TetR/AcrR family transcriptional regulator [unclassified Tenacibaculum]|uniref:TetR/AcrR family transcriptional regulator n=1 Tax=unclassified Tenacibaculum TaxID=2635139 RepID=UPI001F297FB0|nr:TetR/AcrR family transcriptional regulator [Tenacibaculum sp. Cn5-34]MCF2874915.1 TetR/AcrR family transcriptional regulator [Tenacibaculum sp. Cn5-1]MCF2934019.1 TetR/AcrR family transcriptional regulator [Tenacibaculum sp. Cn5-34]MCG7510229.1 TetR/AcrR family transcriptional regulator [Tenacibaculum sp. Cn5-46]
MSKSEKTKAFIIETVAPIFNKNGYSAMSLSKITQATGLTKGAIYGHFENKEELAIEAFRFSVRNVLKDLNAHINKDASPIEKLYNIASFYENYYNYSKQFGGCPILNIGVDSNNQNTAISNLVRSYNTRILEQFSLLIETGKQANEIKPIIDNATYAKRFFYMIEGAVYMSYIMKDPSFLTDLSLTMKQIIQQDLQL